MKPSLIFGIIICLLLVLTVAGCTDSKVIDQQKTSHENAPTVVQPTQMQTTEEPAPSSTVKQSSPAITDINKEIPTADGNLTINFLDVGQGDAILITCDNKSMLIDSGEKDQGGVVSSFLKNQGITKLDYVVATHPHSDHIGSMVDILNGFKVEHFIDSGYPHTSKTYEDMLAKIDQKNIPFLTPKRGDKVDFSSGVDIEVLNPRNTYFNDDLNQNSVVLKVTDRSVSFLLMGDAGIEAENEIKGAGYNVDADILKVGHHGSRTANGASFISAVSPAVSVIEVGAGNDYGHPHQETLDKLQKISKVYRTDLEGTTTISTDGTSYSVTTQKTEPGQSAASTSAGNVAYNSAISTTTPKSEPTEVTTSSSVVSTVYVSDMSLTDEWVKVKNKGSSSVSLSGWKIEDEGSKHTFTFPSYMLDAASTVTLYTGKGTDSANEIYWQSSSPVWNNDGDTAYLYDNSGKLVSILER